MKSCIDGADGQIQKHHVRDETDFLECWVTLAGSLPFSSPGFMSTMLKFKCNEWELGWGSFMHTQNLLKEYKAGSLKTGPEEFVSESSAATRQLQNFVAHKP